MEREKTETETRGPGVVRKARGEVRERSRQRERERERKAPPRESQPLRVYRPGKVGEVIERSRQKEIEREREKAGHHQGAPQNGRRTGSCRQPYAYMSMICLYPYGRRTKQPKRNPHRPKR